MAFSRLDVRHLRRQPPRQRRARAGRARADRRRSRRPRVGGPDAAAPRRRLQPAPGAERRTSSTGSSPSSGCGRRPASGSSTTCSSPGSRSSSRPASGRPSGARCRIRRPPPTAPGAPDPPLRSRAGRGSLRDTRGAIGRPVVGPEAAAGRAMPYFGHPQAADEGIIVATSTRKKSTRRPKASRSAERPDKNIEAFRDALEKSITLPRERIQEVVDDAVKRGRMTRDDANELVSKLVSRGRKQSEELVKDLEALLDQARKRVEKQTTKARRQVKGTAGKVARAGPRRRRRAARARRHASAARRASGRLPDHRLRRADRGPDRQAPRRALEARAPQGPDLREEQQGPQEHPRQDRQGARLSAPASQARPQRGAELDLRVDSLAQGGRGVARTDEGFVVFVAGGLPGDHVRARVGKSKKSWAEAAIVELLEAGPDRIADPACTAASPAPAPPGRACRTSVSSPRSRRRSPRPSSASAGSPSVELEPIVAAVEQWRYRNKLEYSFGAPGPDDPPADPVLGFHARGRWDRIIDVDDCRLASDGQQRGPQRRPRVGARRGPARSRRLRGGRAPQPDRPRGAPDGPGPDPPRHRGRRDPPPAGRPPHGHRGAVRRHRRPDRRPR